MRDPSAPWHAFLARALGTTTAPSEDGSSLRSQLKSRGIREDLVLGVVELVMFMYQGQVDAAEPASWKLGGRVGTIEWAKLVAKDTPAGRYPLLQQWIGECLSWWYEDTAPEVRLAGRPSPTSRTPVIDSVSLVSCREDPEGVAVRGVQAKATLSRARGDCLSSFKKFQALQEGEFTVAWNDALLRLRGELADAGTRYDLARFQMPAGRRHFGVFVLHAESNPSDPGYDYKDHVEAEPHGRVLSLYEEPAFAELVERVAVEIKRRCGLS